MNKFNRDFWLCLLHDFRPKIIKIMEFIWSNMSIVAQPRVRLLKVYDFYNGEQ